ncbi:hypothetical protein GW17_00043982, partial [Ensete ventricosum]
QPQLGHPFPNCCGYPLAETNPKTEEEGDVDDDGLRPRKRSAAFAVAVTSVASRGRRPQVLSPWRRRWQPEVLWTRNLGSSARVVLVPPLLSLRSTYMSHSPRQDEIESPFCARECGFAEKKLEATIPPFRGNRRVNSKATIMFSGFIDDEVHENIIWSEVPYLTDEQGVQKVIIGLDNIEMLAEMEVLGPSDLEFGVEEISSSEDDIDDESEEVRRQNNFY